MKEFELFLKDFGWIKSLISFLGLVISSGFLYKIYDHFLDRKRRKEVIYDKLVSFCRGDQEKLLSDFWGQIERVFCKEDGVMKFYKNITLDEVESNRRNKVLKQMIIEIGYLIGHSKESSEKLIGQDPQFEFFAVKL